MCCVTDKSTATHISQFVWDVQACVVELLGLCGDLPDVTAHDDIVLAVRELSEFYKANGSRAALDKPTRDSVLEKLYDARDALPKAPPTLADRLLGL